MIVLPAQGLRELGARIYAALGSPEEKAMFVAETLVEANLTGHDSHGVHYFVHYSRRIREGFIKPEAEPRVEKETASSAMIDGRWGFGQVTAMRTMEVAVEKARDSVVAAVGAYNCNHIGRIGYYTEWAAKQDMIGLLYVNVGNPSASVYNGMGRAFGTNPLSVSVPTGSETPFLVDYATSVVAHGKVSVARAKHERIPRHWARDKYGRETDDPNALYDGGWLLPFGLYKGYGLQLVTELLGAVLTGSRTGRDEAKGAPSSNGVFAIAINPEGFVGANAFKEKTGWLLRKVKEIEPVAGERVLVPGEPEKESKARRLAEGIPLPEETWGQIVELCEELGVDHQIA